MEALFDEQKAYEALARLLTIARGNSGQARRVANFLLAWHNADENGGWDPVDLWNVDESLASDILKVLALVKESRRYPDGLGFEKEIKAVWELWRTKQTQFVPPLH